MKLHRPQKTDNKFKHSKAFSLLEMVVTLGITSFIMLALVGIFANVLRISATTAARSKGREDIAAIAQEFEKDIKNASTVVYCDGAADMSGNPITDEDYNHLADFTGDAKIMAPEANAKKFLWCEYTTGSSTFVWTICERSYAQPATVDGKSGGALIKVWNNPASIYSNSNVYDIGSIHTGFCKYNITRSGGTISSSTLVSMLNGVYNVNFMSVQIVPEFNAAGSVDTSKRVISFVLVASHPNKRLNVKNLIRQSLVPTKNFELNN